MQEVVVDVVVAHGFGFSHEFRTLGCDDGWDPIRPVKKNGSLWQRHGHDRSAHVVTSSHHTDCSSVHGETTNTNSTQTHKLHFVGPPVERWFLGGPRKGLITNMSPLVYLTVTDYFLRIKFDTLNHKPCPSMPFHLGYGLPHTHLLSCVCHHLG